MKNKMRENRVEKLLGICFFAAGILMLVIAIICAVFSGHTKKTADKITGTITGIYSSRDDDTNGNSSITVSYSYKGQQYETGLGEYSSSMWVGKDIDLYVDKDDPGKVRTGELLFLPTLILAIIAVPFLVIGGIFLMIAIKQRKKKEYLMQHGKRVMAEVTGGSRNLNYTVNGRHPWKLECRYEDIFSDEIYLFSSGNVWMDPELYIGQQVSVYVEGENYKKYYVDVDGLCATGSYGVQIHDYR